MARLATPPAGSSGNLPVHCHSVSPTTDCDCIEIVIAHNSGATRVQLQKVLASLGHDIRGVCQSVDELRSTCDPQPPDLIVTSVELDGGSAIDALLAISEREPTPAIVVTPKTSLATVEEALRDHVMAYLVEPLDFEQIKPTVYLVCERFKQFELLKEENEDLRQTLADRRIIERAKGILMGQLGINEETAFAKLRSVSQSKRTKLVQIAQAVLDSAEINARAN